MVKLGNVVQWEPAILAVVEKLGGSATLKELYLNVPQLKSVSHDAKSDHIIRAYLRRMTRVSHKLKKIGIGTYAVPNFKLEQAPEVMLAESKQGGAGVAGERPYVHSQIEGMLLELGNIYGYLTYTADPSAIFNGKTLDKFSTLEAVPAFTTPALVSIVGKIDVVWFRKRALVTMPKHTFDVELTTDFSKALHRAYQLRDFKASFYLVSAEEKLSQFQKKVNTDPYTAISDRFYFRSFEEIASLYESAAKHSSLMDKVIVEAA